MHSWLEYNREQALMTTTHFTASPRRLTAVLDVQQHLPELLALFDAVRAAESFSPRKLNALAIRHIHEGDMPVPQAGIIKAYEQLAAEGVIPFERGVFERLRLKPTRTVSG